VRLDFGAWFKKEMADPGEDPVREPTRQEVDQLQGLVVLEFGAQWCGYCVALLPHLTRLMREFPQVRHIRVEDGPGRPLGRSFQVKLWPTLIFLSDGTLVYRAVRPNVEEVRAGFLALVGGSGTAP
jgi:thioredoxin 1